MWMTYVPADNVWMMYTSADDMRMTYSPADDVQMMSRQCPDDICHPPAKISNEVSLSCHPHIVHMSYIHHLHIIRHEISTPKYFQSKSREQFC